MKKLPFSSTVVAALAICLPACGGSSGTEGHDPPTQAIGAAGAGAAASGGANAGSGGSGAAGFAEGGAAGRGGAAQGGGAQGGNGGRDQAGAAGQNNVGGSSDVVPAACLKPAGTEVAAQDYTLPTGCSHSSGVGGPGTIGMSHSITITDEATFAQTFNCSEGVASGIDFATQRLELAVYQAAGPATRTWTVETVDDVEIGLSTSAWCGGAAPPFYFTLVLLPVGPKIVVQALCTSNCNVGAGGFPP